MCYSAQVQSEYKKYVRYVGRDNALDIKAFFKKYWERLTDSSVKIPKAIDTWFASDPDAHANNIRQAIAQWSEEQSTKLEQELFKQKKRLVDAERTLQTKTIKKAQEDQRIATDKIEWTKTKLGDLRRTN